MSKDTQTNTHTDTTSHPTHALVTASHRNEKTQQCIQLSTSSISIYTVKLLPADSAYGQ